MNEHRNRAIRMVARTLVAAGFAALVASSAACEKPVLVAPTGSALTLVATAATVSANGSIEITAIVFEGSFGPGSGQNSSGTVINPGEGQPVRDGTNVAFVANLGRFDSQLVTTKDGEAKVTFFGDGRAGTAKITAVSGPASASLDIVVTPAAAASR
jgi:hypothetical protein